jgi:putative hemolysin
VIIANHPYGVVDGLIMGYLASLVRSHFCVLVNEVLTHQDPRLNEQLLPIDFGETRAALQTNLLTRKEALGRLERGEAIVIFPSGGVATSPKGWGKAEDLEWKRFTAKMIQMAKATVVPVYVPGQNSRLFQLASQISPALRLGMLLNEVRNKMGSQIKLEIGDPIPFATLASVKDRQLLLDLLREKTFSLADKHSNP